MTQTPQTPQLQPTALMAELLFDGPNPPLDGPALREAARAFDPESELVSKTPDGRSVMLVHPRWSAEVEGRSVPMASVVMPPNDDATPREIDPAQSWMFPGALQAVAKGSGRCLVAQVMGQAHDVAARRAGFLAGLRAAVTVLRPSAVWFPLSDQVLAAEQVLSEDLLPFVNVRLFGVAGTTDAVVMDTCGVAAFALPDLQCVFRGLDHSAMARVLYNTAAYVLENGDVIADGHTIAGPQGDEKWEVVHAEAVAAPARVVLDINPGEEHAIGVRP